MTNVSVSGYLNYHISYIQENIEFQFDHVNMVLSTPFGLPSLSQPGFHQASEDIACLAIQKKSC